jgi:hypothetical protein
MLVIHNKGLSLELQKLLQLNKKITWFQNVTTV